MGEDNQGTYLESRYFQKVLGEELIENDWQGGEPTASLDCRSEEAFEQVTRRLGPELWGDTLQRP